MTGPFLHPFAKPAKPSFIRLVSGEGATVGSPWFSAKGTPIVNLMPT